MGLAASTNMVGWFAVLTGKPVALDPIADRPRHLAATSTRQSLR
jgi:hypothetical protein